MSLGWPVTALPEIDSTNLEARRRAEALSFPDQWIIANRQAAGKGRMGRVWLSPEGNIFASALYREPGGLSVALRSGFAASLAVCDAIESVIQKPLASVKWPNDVRINHEKIAGILIETGNDSSGLWVIAGIGLNVRVAPDDTGQPVTCIAAHLDRLPPSAEDVFVHLRRAYGRWLECSRTQPADLYNAWRKRADGLGKEVTVMMGQEKLRGVFEDIDEKGAMLLRLQDGVLKPILAGDVTLSRIK